MINFHTHHEDKLAAIQVIQVYPKDGRKAISKGGLRDFSLGLHPWYVTEDYLNELEELRNVLATPSLSQRVIAVGECGIDRVINRDYLELQLKVFREQIRLANQYKKALVIHCVRAHQEILQILKQEENKMPVVFHGVNNKFETIAPVLEAGYFCSFGYALFVEGAPVLETFMKTPLDRLFLESDDREDGVAEVYKRAAFLKGMDLKLLKQNIRTNYKKLYVK
jgi:TatD DNase family protein